MNINSKLPIKGNTVLIIGNRSYKNMGDELILLGTIKLLLQQSKKIIISCYNPKRLKQFFSQFIDTKSITFIHELPKGFKSTFQRLKKGGLKELRYFRHTDTVILGGGEILTEENPSSYRYRLAGMRPFLLRLIASEPKAKRSNPESKRFLYLMGGVQIPQKKSNLRRFKFLLNHTTYLYLRDFQAVAEIKKFCSPRTQLRGFPKIEFFMDTSYFAYDWSVIANKQDITANSQSEAIQMKQNNQKNIHTMDCFAPLHSARNDDKKPYIIVNLNKNGERFLPNIAKDIQPYINKGYTIYFVPIAKGHNTYYNDLQYKTQLEQYVIASEVIDETRQSKNLIQLLDREDDFANFVQILKKAEVVIGTRLHLFLIASFLHVPTKVYPYQRKILKMQEVIKELSHNKQKN